MYFTFCFIQRCVRESAQCSVTTRERPGYIATKKEGTCLNLRGLGWERLPNCKLRCGLWIVVNPDGSNEGVFQAERIARAKAQRSPSCWVDFQSI